MRSFQLVVKATRGDRRHAVYADETIDTPKALTDAISGAFNISPEEVKLFVRADYDYTEDASPAGAAPAELAIEYCFLPTASALSKVQRVLHGDVDAIPKEGNRHVLYIDLQGSSGTTAGAAATPASTTLTAGASAQTSGASSGTGKKGRRPTQEWHHTTRLLGTKHGMRGDDGMLRCSSGARARAQLTTAFKRRAVVNTPPGAAPQTATKPRRHTRASSCWWCTSSQRSRWHRCHATCQRK